ncbi:MAG: Peptidylprolyl isomerase, partial [Bacteroidota bacterium]
MGKYKNCIFVFLFLMLVASRLLAQSPVPLQIGPKKITAEVFEKDYRRLLESDSIRSDNKQKFLSAYIDYHLKILAAEADQIPTSPGFQDEYQSFRKELASPYLIDNVKVEALVREAYERLKFEKQVAHILVRLPANPSPSDTLIAYQKITNIQKKLQAGEDFTATAKKFSEDELSAVKGGQIGYITSLQTQYAFENSVYALEKGEVSNIVRTETGYHLIKVLEIRPNQGKIRLAHILISAAVNAPTSVQVEAKNKIDLVQKYLAKGEEPFELICKNYSEDPYSRSRGGELRRWYYSSDLSEELQDKLFGIQRLGDVTEPIRTNLGWQIFKLLDKKPLLSYEEMAEYLRQKVLTDGERSAIIRQSFMKRVRMENNVKVDEVNRKIAIERYAQDRIGDEPYLQLPLFSIGSTQFLIKEFYAFIVAQQRKKLKALGYLPTISEAFWLEEFIDLNTIQAEEKHLETKYPAFKEQMQEFYEGSLFSKITEREVYDKSLDSLRQQTYFTANTAKFTLPSRLQAKVLSADTPKTLADAMELLKNPPYPMNKRFPDLIFGVGQSVLPEGSTKNLQELFIQLAKNKDYIVEISGHQDASEMDTLAQARISKVVAYLTKKGIGVSRIIEKVEGNLRPASKTDKSKNARISFKFYSPSMEDVVKRFNSVKPLSLEASEGLFKRGENAILDSLSWEVGKKNFEAQGRHLFVDIKEVVPARLKSFEESRSSIIRDLQVELEKNWLIRLKERFPVVRNEEELNKIM